MRLSRAAQGSLLLALTAVGVTAQTASRRRINVKAFKTNYKIDTWDDGRDELYRVTYRKFGLKSVYTFDAAGHVKTLTARDTKYTFDNFDMPARMLLDSSDDAIEEVDFDVSSLIDCDTCGVTWNTLCDVGLAEVCLLNDNNPVEFDEDAGDSVRRYCSAMGAACETPAEEVCGGAECVIDACNPNPCENGGSCANDPAGGHICSCASDFGGMSCQTNTTSLAPFAIDFDFIGNWTDARRAVFRLAADRWSEVITHVPCGGSPSNPAGRLLIAATIGEIALGFTVSPTSVWTECRGISLLGELSFDNMIFDLLTEADYAETSVLHFMGNVIGVGTLWGAGFAECSACSIDEEPLDASWTCPAALRAFSDLGGSGADIVETKIPFLDCNYLDNEIFGDELSASVIKMPSFLSKMTAAVLEDIGYIVDPSMVDAYVLPSQRDEVFEDGPVPSILVAQTAVQKIILSVDSDGNVDDEIVGVAIGA